MHIIYCLASPPDLPRLFAALPVGFSDSKMHTATGPGIASILAVICESNHAHFLTSFRSDKVNALWHKVNTLWHKKQP